MQSWRVDDFWLETHSSAILRISAIFLMRSQIPLQTAGIRMSLVITPATLALSLATLTNRRRSIYRTQPFSTLAPFSGAVSQIKFLIHTFASFSVSNSTRSGLMHFASSRSLRYLAFTANLTALSRSSSSDNGGRNRISSLCSPALFGLTV